MKNIDLLPIWARKIKHRRIQAFIIATVQVVIFLSIFTVLFVFYTLAQREFAIENEWSARLQFIDPAWENAATTAAAAMSNAAQLESFLINNNTYPFDAAWFISMIETVPHEAEIVRMVYSDAEILITVRVADIALAEIHRHNIASAALFYNVMLGRIIGLGEGFYSYELRIQT